MYTVYMQHQQIHSADNSLVLCSSVTCTWFSIFVSSATRACAQLLKVTRLLSQCAIVLSRVLISCWLIAGLITLQNLKNLSFDSLPCFLSSISLKASTIGANARSCSSRFHLNKICRQKDYVLPLILLKKETAVQCYAPELRAILVNTA